MQLEICCGDPMSIFAAKEGGAKRIELCSGLAEGGVTPSYAMIKTAVESGIPMINVLIRPRPGDFLYSKEELKLMQSDIRNAIREGATGIVTGVLTAEGEIDVEAMQNLIDIAKNEREDIDITFHRAFDVSKDIAKSLDDIIRLGCNTLLTSGMAQNAVKGMTHIKKLTELAGEKILIMAGGGVNPSNACEIIKITGVKAIHSTARKPFPSKMKFRRPLVSMGIQGLDEYSMLSTSAETVANLLKCISLCEN